MVVLGVDHVLQKDGARTAVTLDVAVEGKVQCDDLHARVGLARIVEGVAGEDVGACSGLEGLVCRISGKVFLELGDPGDILHQFLGAGLVLEQHERLVGALDAEQLVVSDLVGADDQVHLAVIHVQPGDGAFVVLVGHEGFSLGKQVGGHARLDSDVRRRLQVVGDLLDIVLVFVVEPYGLQRAVLGAAYKGVGAVLVGVFPGVELLPGHVCGIEAGAGKAVAVSLYE